jgi:hypothetical protein
MSLPLLGWIGVLVLVGWKFGPWPPLGIAAATALLLALGWRLGRPPPQLQGDPLASQRWRDARVNKIGRLLGAVTGAWLASSVVLLVAIVVVALVAR